MPPFRKPSRRATPRDPLGALTRHPMLTPRLPVWRSKLVMIIMCIAFAALAARALWIQVVDHRFYVGQGQKRYERTLALDAKRGPIVDRNGALLAVSLDTFEVWAYPKLLEAATHEPLAKLLDIPRTELERRLASDRSFMLLRRQIDAETAAQIERLSPAALVLTADSKRFYPEGESAAHVVGFTDIEDDGQEGIELAANDRLRGTPGQRKVIRDRLGRVISEPAPRVPPRHGETLQLTIDRRVQQLAYAQLRAAVAKHNAQAGSVVVLDARNGEILALANWPSFDPNNRARLSGRELRNRAVVDTFEPGSTIKPVVVALSMDERGIGPQTVIDTSPGSLRIGQVTIHDTSNHGRLTVAQAIQKSSNVALAKLALDLPARTIWDKYQQYGLGQKPDLAFPGAAAGRLRPYARWRPVEQATMAYGYGLSLSLLQLAQVYTAYAGDGTLRPVQLVGNPAPEDAAPAVRRVTKPATAAQIRAMLELATAEGGTGRAATIDGYRVGGKTGTARRQEGGGYAKNRYRSVFVGMAPMSDPRLIVAVMIDDPSGPAYYGGTVAGPVFAGVTAGTLQLLGVPPDA